MSATYTEVSTKDMKRALETHFKWRGFSVRGGRGRYVTISWTNGPTTEQVRALTSRWNDTKNDDITTDLWVGSQYTSERRSIEPERAWRILQSFDLREGRYSTPDGMPPIWELVQAFGRAATYGSGFSRAADGWGAGEDWLELVNVTLPHEIEQYLEGFRALGYSVSVRTLGKCTRYGFTR